MEKHEVKKALDCISEMSNEEITLSAEFIRKVTTEAYALIGSLESAIYKKRKRR